MVSLASRLWVLVVQRRRQHAAGECLRNTSQRVKRHFASRPISYSLCHGPLSSPQSFEQLNPRAVAVVIDPIQSVRGKVVIDCFRTINPHLAMAGQEARQTTSNVGHLNKPSIQALIHNLNRQYYSAFLCPVWEARG